MRERQTRQLVYLWNASFLTSVSQVKSSQVKSFDRLPYGCLLFMYRLDLNPRACVWPPGRVASMVCLSAPCPRCVSTRPVVVRLAEMAIERERVGVL